jgi:hypothetical protein
MYRSSVENKMVTGFKQVGLTLVLENLNRYEVED